MFNFQKNKQPEKMWGQFRGKGNTDEILIEKAKAVPAVIVAFSAEGSRSLFRELKSDEKKGEVFLEMVIFYLHVVDRTAFQYLETEQRHIFIDALFIEIRELLSRIHENGIDAARFRSSFDDMYNERQLEYGKYEKMFARQNEGKGGTLFWEFQKKVTGMISFEYDILVMGKVLDIIASYVIALQLPELFGDKIKELQKEAEQGDAKAQYNLGLMYAKGEEIPKDSAKAVEWFLKSANQGDPIAQHSLGLMYSDGEGVVKDFNMAIQWYQKAAVQGYASSQYNLALMYYNGEGTPKDLVLAYAWFNLSATQEGESKKYAKKARGMVDKKLTPVERAEAQSLFSNWKIGEILKRAGK